MKKKLGIILLAFLSTLSSIFGVMKVYAQPSYDMAATKTATATTTLNWLTPGAGTTTVTLPTPLSLGMSTKYDKAIVMFEMSATNTVVAPKMNIRIEHSMDGIDWFSETAASSSSATIGLMPSEFAFNMATSSTYSNTGNTVTRLHSSLLIDTPTAYNRVVFYDPVGGSNISLWAAVQPYKEIQLVNQ